MIADPMVTVLSRLAQEELADVAARRADEGKSPLSLPAQRALATKVVTAELGRIDQQRLASGELRLSELEEARITEEVVASSTGLGAVDVMLNDETIEEIVATRFDLLFTYHSDGSVRRVERPPWSVESEMVQWLSFVARTKGRTERQFNSQNPLLVMRLGDGLRLAASRDVSQHASFSLRRNILGKVTLPDLVGLGMFPALLGELFRAFALAHEMRWVIVGATSAGKTTLMRAMLNELPPERRVIVIEDTAEVEAFDEVLHPNVESWEVREPNSEGEGAILHDALVAHALRYRPDLLTVGECRDSVAAVPMLKAMTHGQASVTTVHAYDARGGMDKLVLFLGTGAEKIPIDAAHHQLSQAVDFFVHVDRGRDGKRYVSEVVELAGFDGQRCTTNTIYTADAANSAGHTMGRLTQPHADKLTRAGFDPARLGGVW
jgi:Flp pilus assembly CpaF family ATPase